MVMTIYYGIPIHTNHLSKEIQAKESHATIKSQAKWRQGCWAWSNP